ncbi:MAG: hypothetical protein OIF58_16300 [Cohaesibacter sp.]|nr:hypothetical protein [Cohaesibacter sp.]
MNKTLRSSLSYTKTVIRMFGNIPAANRIADDLYAGRQPKKRDLDAFGL